VGPTGDRFFHVQINPESDFQCRKNRLKWDKNPGNLWMWEIQFGTLFIINTSFNSPWILNYLNLNPDFEFQ
jgi:hypothetical protein